MWEGRRWKSRVPAEEISVVGPSFWGLGLTDKVPNLRKPERNPPSVLGILHSVRHTGTCSVTWRDPQKRGRDCTSVSVERMVDLPDVTPTFLCHTPLFWGEEKREEEGEIG